MVRRASAAVVAAMFCVTVAARPVDAQSPAGDPALRDDLARAERVQRSVQQRFWLERRQLYVGRAGGDRPAAMWDAGIAFSALDAACRYDPATYRPILPAYFRSLDAYWDRDALVPGYEPYPTQGHGHDKYYDDNAWMAITFTEGYELTGDARLLSRAQQTCDFVLSGWDEQLGGGIWWQEAHKDGSKNTCANAPAAVACLALAGRLAVTQPADATRYRAAARRIVQWTRAHLQRTDGRFADHVNVATGQVARFALTYNTALMIRAQLMLARQEGAGADLAEAEGEARACDAFVDPRTGGYRDAVRWSHLLVEADLAVARQTHDAALAQHLQKRARAAVDADYLAWQGKPSVELIDVAALARELWLLCDAKSPQGQAFWRRSDGAGMRTGAAPAAPQ